MDHSPHDLNQLDAFAQQLANLRVVPQSVDRDEILFRAGQQSVQRLAAPRRMDFVWRLAAIASTSAALLLGFLCLQLNQARTEALKEIVAARSELNNRNESPSNLVPSDPADGTPPITPAVPSTDTPLDRQLNIDRWAAQPVRPSMLQVRNRLLQVPLDELATVAVSTTDPNRDASPRRDNAGQSISPLHPRLDAHQIHDLLSPGDESL
ncbi:MAG: hypothetical protein U0795_23790 [Pirellulales bacterium]